MILHILAGFILLLGILLNILSFYAYSKLKSNCEVSGNLKTNLRISICIGSFFTAAAISFFVCTSNCDIETDKKWLIYSILFFMLIMGIYLSILTSNIKSQLKECQEDIGSLPTILLLLSIIEVSVIVIGAVIYIYNSNKKNKKTDKNSSSDEDKDKDNTSKFSTIDELKSEKEESEKELIKEIKLDIADKENDIAKTKISLRKLEKVEKGKRDEKWRKNYNKELSNKTALLLELKKNKNELNELTRKTQKTQKPSGFVPSFNSWGGGGGDGGGDSDDDTDDDDDILKDS